MKRKLMLLVAILALVSSASFAQLKYGGGLSFGTKSAVDDDGDTNLGLGINLRVDYSLNEKWSIAPNLTFWFPGQDLTFWQFNADAHYTISGDEALSFYGIGGLNYSHIGDGDYSEDEIGLNLGIGTFIKERFFGELKYDTAGNTVDGQLALTVGILF